MPAAGIENEILMHLRKNAAQRTELSLDEPLNTDLGWKRNCCSAMCWEQTRIRSCGPLKQMWTGSCLDAAISKLSEREQEIIVLRFGLRGNREQTQKEVADRLGISQSYISRLEKRIINRLRRDILRMS